MNNNIGYIILQRFTCHTRPYAIAHIIIRFQFYHEVVVKINSYRVYNIDKNKSFCNLRVAWKLNHWITKVKRLLNVHDLTYAWNNPHIVFSSEELYIVYPEMSSIMWICSAALLYGCSCKPWIILPCKVIQCEHLSYHSSIDILKCMHFGPVAICYKINCIKSIELNWIELFFYKNGSVI